MPVVVSSISKPCYLCGEVVDLSHDVWESWRRNTLRVETRYWHAGCKRFQGEPYQPRHDGIGDRATRDRRNKPLTRAELAFIRTGKRI